MLAKAESVLHQLLVLSAVMLTGSLTPDCDFVDTAYTPNDKLLEGEVSQNEFCGESAMDKHEGKVSRKNMFMGITNAVKIDNVCGLSKGYKSYGYKPFQSKRFEEVIDDLNFNIQSRCTSVWCHLSHESSLHCRFSNLYYNPLEEDFVFVYCNQSIVYGIEDLKALQKELYLSSVDSHSAFRLSISVIPWAVFLASYKSYIVPGQSIITARFKPDNILHVFHDDLLPVYFTGLEICVQNKSCQSDLNIIFIDKNDHGKYWSLYKILSERVSLISDLSQAQKSKWICFTTVYMGLNKMSVWYQYGFGKPQGPSGRNNFSGHLLRQFTNYVLKAMNIKTPQNKAVQGLLFSRKANRKILNEKEVLGAIRTSLTKVNDGQGISVKILSEEENDFHEILEELIKTRMVVGVHGAVLILSIFLPPGSVLIEIFPFGINPSAATVYKTMCELKDIGITYMPWTNKDLKNTISHLDYPSYYGGLDHFTPDEREKIIQDLKEREITSVECCDDPTWLIRIYQDTIVHINRDNAQFQSAPFIETLSLGLMKSEINRHNMKSSDIQSYIYPAKVRSAECMLERTSDYAKLFIHWRQPWNIKQNMCTDLFYEVIIQVRGDANAVHNEVYEERYFRKLRPDVEDVDVWITCYCNNVEGIEMYLTCK